jgi:broad specificity phosphatase PhoE
MAERRIMLVRHPETTANVDGRWVGRGNTAFTELGTAQVGAIVRELDAWGAEIIWSSPQQRALEPARKTSLALGIPHRIDDRLQELDFGAAEGLTFAEAEAAGIAFDFMAQNRPVAPGGESRAEIYARTASICDEIVASAPARAAIVTHGGVFRSALVHLLSLPLEAIWAFHISNAELAEVIVRDGHGMLERFDVAR